ncbi:MAG: hypothetical protein JWS10_2563 [Cypionkella sp.]|uniref:hypothetical protein n=1 Tax=Cypionkella sp. TaxID=2811411 RepID=UPI00262A7023|nr:hypothetical protein [Cypionkella sp.]MDB5659948.1 hypothetical protein [Cypionkella sp.]
MAKSKEKEKKSSQLVLRIEKQEKDRFIAACEAIDSSAGREIRRFMREFVAAQSAAQPDIKSPEAAVAPAEPEVAATAETAAAPAHQPETAEAAAAAKPKPAKKTKK